MSPELQLLVILIAFVGFWYVVSRPARAQQRRVAEVQNSLVIGEEVVISSGIFGSVRSIEEDRIGLEVAPGTVITVARQVVVRRLEETDEIDRDLPGDQTQD